MKLRNALQARDKGHAHDENHFLLELAVLVVFGADLPVKV
jgi:hypothetical protein